MKTKKVSIVSLPPDLRSRILKRSRELFFKHGYSNLSLDELAADLGISKATIYRYFSDKEALLRTVIEETKEWVLSHLVAIVKDERPSVKDKLAAFLEFLSRFMSGISQELIRDLRQKLPHLWKEMDEFRRRQVFPLISEIVSEGVQKKEVKPDLDTRLFLEIFWHLVQEFMNPDWLISHDYAPSELLHKIFHIMFYGILVEKNSRKKSSRAKFTKRGRK